MKTRLLQLSFILTLAACNSGSESAPSSAKQSTPVSTLCANQSLIYNYPMENVYYNDFGDALYFNDDCTGSYEVCSAYFTYTPITQTINNPNGVGNGSYFSVNITEVDEQVHGCPPVGNYDCVAIVSGDNVSFQLWCDGVGSVQGEEILLVLNAPNGSNYY